MLADVTVVVFVGTVEPADGFGDDGLGGLSTVRLSVDVVAMLEMPDEVDKGGLHDDVGGQ